MCCHNTSRQTEIRKYPAAASLKKPVTTASLDVNDATGTVNTLYPAVKISAEPASLDQDIALRLTGLPADAYLTAGTKLANNARP